MRTEGLANLYRLPTNIKEEIINKYGSLEDYYFEVYYLDHTKYNLFIQDKVANQAKIDEVTHKIYDMEEELEDWGADDGSSILIPISDDHGDIIVNKTIDELNKHLAQYGTDFETMRKWLQKKIGS
jgi:ribosomal protein S15P/S13E